MKLDEIYVLYENSGKYFKSYDEAYYNSKKPFMLKGVNYVFTPTMQKFKRVCELENACRSYFNRIADCDYLNVITGQSNKQIKLFMEV